MNAFQRLWSSIPFVLALAVLLYLGWSASLALSYPYDGVLRYSASGTIIEIDPSEPAYNILQEGDILLFVDGVPWLETQAPYAGKEAGDDTLLTVDRAGVQIPLTIQLADASFDELMTRLAPLLVAFVFWLVAVGVQAFKPAYEPTGLFYIFFQLTAVLLISGVNSFLGPAWTTTLLSFCLWWVGPIAVHFHLRFPQKTDLGNQNILIIGLYTIAALGGLPYLVWGAETIQASPWYYQLFIANRLLLTTSFLLVVGLLIYSYQHAITPGVRGKIRIVVLGGILSLLPLVSLIIIPDFIMGVTVIPYSLLFLFLGILPLTYGYAIFRYRLIEIERHVNRGATFILVYSILGGFYLVLYAFLNRAFPETFGGEPMINTLIVLVLASIIVPLHKQVQVVVDTLFYGGWYDYRLAVTQITQGLEQTIELQPLAKMVSDRLVRTLHLQDACVFVRDQNGDFTVIDVAPRLRVDNQLSFAEHPLPRSSISYLLEIGEIERTSLRQALSEVFFTREERELLNTEQDHLWVPIIGHGQVQGLMALGPKFGGDIFSGEDLDILRVVARQIGPVIENIHLLNRLREYAAGLELRVRERTAELHDAMERVEAFLVSAGDGVIVTDLDGSILILNPAYEDQSGYSANDLVGTNLFSTLARNNPGELLEEMRFSLKGGDVWRGELVNLRRDGNIYDIQMTIAPVRDQLGKTINYVSSLRDITVQKELDRMKDIFVSDVSHELRTPTTNISLYLELMEYASPAKRDEYLEILKEQAHQLRKLVEDILDLSRLTMGKFKKIEFSAIDINSVTEQVITAHQPLAEASGIELKFSPCPDMPAVRGEENQLGRLITNLVSNALRYTPEGRVEVRTSHFDHQACLWVQDTGMGIDPDDLPHLFDRFYRGRGVRQTRIHGTGLGLAIVKEIVDLHEGQIDIQSKPNEGSTFCIRLPIYEE
jgi:two-component system phosphate regulon sensor histidine kinase PhoR